MRAYSRLVSLAAVAALTTALPATGAKTAFRYEAAQRVIKACVLYVDQDPDPAVEDFTNGNANPYLIEGLRRSDLCPDDWEFENPLADPAVVAGRPNYVVKGNPSYWRVDLTDDTARQLVGFDLIYICAPLVHIPSEVQQDGLVKAVENGALLWVDNDVANAGTIINEFAPPYSPAPPAPPFQFSTGSEAATNVRVALDATHGILSEPFKLNSRHVRALGDLPDSSAAGLIGNPTDDFVSIFPTDVFSVVVQVDDGTNLLPNILAGSFGSGSIVLTASGVGSDVAGWISDRRNAPSRQQAPDVKLALNMIQWADRWEQARRQPRAGATSVARAPFPLDIAWQFPGREEDVLSLNIGQVVCSPVYGRGMVYAVSLTSDGGTPAMLMCFDVDPEQDLDGDGVPDDGAGDYGAGAPYDMIWRAPLTDVVNDPSPRFSSPTLATINVNNGTIEVPVQVVLVSVVDRQNGAAGVACYNATIDPSILAALPGGFAGIGQVIWAYAIPAYSATAEVICLSTPIVHRGYVYVLASEYDTMLAAGVEGTYGRAHCFDLASGGTTATWVYPTPDTDIDGDGTPGLNAEHQRSLPAFNEPGWVAQGPARRDLPYVRGAIPVLSSIADRVDGIGVDALLTFGTPVTHEFSGGVVQIAGWTSWTNRDGGSEFALIPTPRNAAGNVMLNEQYFRVRLNHEETDGNPANDTVNATVRADDGGIALASLVWDGSRYAVYEPGQVREAMAARSATGIDDPIQLQTGAQVLVDYTYDGTAVTGEPHWLPGPVRWKHEFGLAEARVCEGSAGVSDIVVTTEVPVDNAAPPNVAASSGKVFLLGGNTSRPEWTYDPKAASPFNPAAKATMQIQATTSPAFDGDTAVVGATTVYEDPPGTDRATSAVIGLRRQTDCSVRLRGDGGTLDSYGVAITENEALVVRLKSSGVEIDPTCYRVDRVSRYLTFPADKASNVTDTSTPPVPLGPIYGQAIEVDWSDDHASPTDLSDDTAHPAELHVVPGLERFYHIAGHIRLRYYPVDWSAGNEPTITLLDEITPVVDAAPVNLTADNLAVDGWIDMRAARIGDATGPLVEAGTEVLVSYTGFSEQYGDPTADYSLVIPNAARNLPAARHQIPIEFGPSASAPAVAGTTIHLGTEGFDGDLDGAFDNPAGPAGLADTLLSMIWDKATGFVRSALSRASEQDVSYAGIPVVSSAPTVAEDRVFVGSRMMTTPALGTGYGFVSAMKPRRLLIADNTRLVETTGSKPSWVCAATLSPQRGQSFVGEELRRPFSRPAKATRLANRNLLVVDTGNNRVVEIDRSGRVIWPLDLRGYEYYTSPDNHNLRLSRPADAHRHVERSLRCNTCGVEQDPNVYSPGDPCPEPGCSGTLIWMPEYHTVIADTGNGRVIEVVTIILGGRQRHEVFVKTPGRVLLNTTPTRYMRVRYTSAQPIYDPGTRSVIGYLCAAANLNQLMIVENGSKLINPPGSRSTPVGSSPGSTWAYWAWLYDDDLTDASDLADDPLLFDNIKHAEYARYGGTIYLTVTCSRYRGRAKAPTPHPLADAGPGVFEFRIDVSDLSNPGTWGVANALDRTGAASIEEPYWHFVGGTGAGADAYGYWYYYDGAAVAQRDMTHIRTAVTLPGEPGFRKRWYPVCAKRMADGRHLIVNSISAIEHATHPNIAAGEADTPLGSHIFQVETANADENNPYNDLYTIPASRSVPEPNQPAWADPFNQPAYAEIE